MPNEEHIRAVLHGKHEITRILRHAKTGVFDIEGGDFTRQTYTGMDWSGWNLKDCIFDNATFKDIKFCGANLDRARFVGAEFEDCDFSVPVGEPKTLPDDLDQVEWHVTGVVFQSAKHTNSSFIGLNLKDADFRALHD